ncbi:MAG TPA: alpha/beta fold hydrolase [Clostridia bacterium]|nr:alpha/beta fold hydrolase [Clostridia bacterium]
MGGTAIIFVHGHMGSVRQFVPLISALGADVSKYNISLPGHDGTVADFVKSDRHVWQRYVTSRVAELRWQFDELVLVGHSMGGLLLINAAIACPDKIKGVIAVSLPLYIKLTTLGIRIRLSCIGKAVRGEDERVTAAREMNGVSGICLANSYKLLPNIQGLLRVMKETRKELGKLTVPLTIMNSANDEIVSLRTLSFARKSLPGVKVVTLKQASHFWFPKEELLMIQDEIDHACLQIKL